MLKKVLLQRQTKNLQDKNMLNLSNFIYRLFNQIKIINLN
jgi:hypothetical protein